jgi:hypothetical protein
MDALKLIEEIGCGVDELRAELDEIDRDRLVLNELRNIVGMLDQIRSYYRPCSAARPAGFVTRP